MIRNEPSFTDEEVQLVKDHNTVETDLRMLRKIMNAPMPEKKYKKFETEILPRYIIREMNLRGQVEKLMKKKGYLRRERQSI